MQRLAVPACGALLSLALSLPAQTPPCASANDSNTSVVGRITGWGFAGPGEYAYQFTPTQTLSVAGMRVYTGNSTPTAAFMRLEIWDHDFQNQLPRSRLTGGTWQTPQPTPVDWMGTNFDKTLVLQASTPYWLVWIDPGGSQFPEELNGLTLLNKVYRFGNTSAWTTTPAAALKFRLYCSPLDAANVVPFGTACASAAGATGTVFTNQPATVGNKDYRIEGTGFPAGAPALFVLGGNPLWPGVSLGASAPGCFLNTDIIVIIPGVTGTGDVRATPVPGAAGHVAITLPLLPPVATGLFFSVQIAALDAQSKNVLPFAFGNALRTTVK